MFILMIGHTCSGTSTLLEQIKKNNKIKILLETTDRPKRFIDEKGYIFLSQEDFDKKKLLCKTEYKTADALQPIYRYGITSDILNLNYKEKNYIIRTNIELLNELINHLNEEYFIIINLFVSSIKEVENRMNTRENKIETKRRFISDIEKINKFEQNYKKNNFFSIESNDKTLKNLYKKCGVK